MSSIYILWNFWYWGYVGSDLCRIPENLADQKSDPDIRACIKTLRMIVSIFFRILATELYKNKTFKTRIVRYLVSTGNRYLAKSSPTHTNQCYFSSNLKELEKCHERIFMKKRNGKLDEIVHLRNAWLYFIYFCPYKIIILNIHVQYVNHELKAIE